MKTIFFSDEDYESIESNMRALLEHSDDEGKQNHFAMMIVEDVQRAIDCPPEPDELTSAEKEKYPGAYIDLLEGELAKSAEERHALEAALIAAEEDLNKLNRQVDSLKEYLSAIGQPGSEAYSQSTARQEIENVLSQLLLSETSAKDERNSVKTPEPDRKKHARSPLSDQKSMQEQSASRQAPRQNHQHKQR